MKQTYTALLCALISISSFAQFPSFQWGGTVGNTYQTHSQDCVGDNNNNVFLVGNFEQNNADFDPGVGVANLSAGTGTNGFVAKYSSTGTYQWAFKIGVTNLSAIVRSVALASNGDIVISGFYAGNNVDFDPSIGVYTLPYTFGAEGFIARYTSAGNLVWAYSLNASGQQHINDICIDASGNIYAVVQFESTVIPDNINGTSFTTLGGDDMLVIKLDGQGNYIHAWQAGGVYYLQGLSIDVGPTGNVYVTGQMHQANNFDIAGSGYTITTGATNNDVFLASYDSSGNFRWAFNTGTDGQIAGNELVLDSNEKVYLTGSARGNGDFDPSGTVYTLAADNVGDAFIASYTNGGAFRWAFLLVENGAAQEGRNIAVDASNNVYTTGLFYGNVDFNSGAPVDTIRTPYNGLAQSSYFAKYDQNGNYQWAFQICPTTNLGAVAIGETIDINASGNMFVSGFIGNDADYDPSAAVAMVPQGNHNLFVARYGSACIPPSAPVSIAGPTTVCSGSPAFYDAANALGASSYNWTFPVGWTGITTADTMTVTTGSTGGVISVSASNACGTSAAVTMNVTVNQSPIVSYNQIPDSICINGPVINLSAGSPAGGIYGGFNVGNTFDPQNTGIGYWPVWYTYTDSNTGCAATDTSWIIVDVCNEIAELDEAVISVYPNPFQEQITIVNASGGTQQIRLYSSDGKLVNAVINQDNQYVLDTKALTPGLYLLIIETTQGRMQQKIVKD
jgi:PKD-like domain/Secretion system C-terminal sorting domain